MPERHDHPPASEDDTETLKAGGALASLGAVQSFVADGATVTFRCAHGLLQLTALDEGCCRVWATRAAAFPALFSYAVAKDDAAWPRPGLAVRDEPERVVVALPGATCVVSKADASVAFQEPAGETLCADAFAGMAWEGDALWLHKQLQPGEAIYGLGQRAFALNLRGRRYALWNLDPVLYDRGDDPVYYSIPFYVAVSEVGRAYGLFADNTYRGFADVGAAQKDRLSLRFEGGELRYYLFAGPTIADVLARYTELTGRIPMPPLWALGYHQCRWSYFPEAKVREIAANFRKRRIPCDALYLDIDYMDGFRCFTWDRERFPDPAAMIRDLRADGFRTVVMIDPAIKVDEAYEVDRSGIAHDAFLKNPDGTLYVGSVWAGPSHFPDYTSPRTRAWWGDLYADLVAMGVEGVWNDMNEPTVFPPDLDFEKGVNTLPDDIPHDWEGQGSTHLAAHNVYGMLMVRATREGLERLRPRRRQFVITRAAHAGAQRYATSWTGDNKSTWDHLRLSISMCLNLGLSGMAFTGPDIGGFGGEPTAELVTRWVQLGMCLPFFRMHTMAGTPDQEPWCYGQPYEDINRRYIAWRYRLLPYLYSAVATCALTGMPIVRPMVMAGDAARFKDVDDQFMLGEHLLVAPALEEGQQVRTVMLPPGVWYDFWTGKRHDGGDAGSAVTVPTPLDALPLFARAGSVIPLWPVMQYTGERPVDELTLRVFAGRGKSALYYDEGDGPDRVEGWSSLELDVLKRALVLQWTRDPRTPTPYGRVRVEVYGVPGEVTEVLLDGLVTPPWTVEHGVLTLPDVPVFKALRVAARGWE